MTESQPRAEGGEYDKKISEQDILLVFDKYHEPFLTAPELADELGVTRQAVSYRLKQMEDKGLVSSKRTGARAIGWWAEVSPRLDPDLTEELEETADEEYAALDRGDTVSHEDLMTEYGIE